MKQSEAKGRSDHKFKKTLDVLLMLSVYALSILKWTIEFFAISNLARSGRFGRSRLEILPFNFVDIDFY